MVCTPKILRDIEIRRAKDNVDRRYEICSPKKIEAWLRFDFSDRRQKREPSKKGLRGTSDMQWRAEHFNGTDYDNRDSKHAIFKLIDDPSTLAEPFIQPKRRKSSNPFLAGRKMGSLLRRFNSDFLNQGAPEADPPRRPGKGWAEDVDKEHGNNDFLMFSNIDYSHSAVREDVVSWGWWMVDEVHVDGFRLDAVQHISFDFIKLWIQSVKDVVRNRNDTSTSLFLVGEVWSGDVGRITKWIDAVDSGGDPRIHAFDAPLLYNFSRISEDFKNKPKNVDLRTILRNSLLEQRPNAAITLVTNHDTQPGQISYTPMERGLKLLWYAFILLRKEGMPCVFWGDLFGTRGHNIEEPPIEVKKDDEGHFKKSYSKKLVKLMLCRKYFAHGEQTDFWDSPLTIAWRRAGDKNRQGSGCFVVLNLASKHHSHKLKPKVPIGRPEEVWVDALEHIDKKVEIDDEGCGKLPTKGPGVSVWIPKGSEHLLELSDELKEGMDIYHE